MNQTKDFYSCSRFYKSNDGLTLHYRLLENDIKRHTIVCLPGLTRNSRDFEELAVHLSKSFNVVCPDLRGRGLSDYDRNWSNYHPLTYADDIWKLMDILEINKFSIIGTSLGGLIAMVMSYQNALRINAIVMNDIGPEIDPKGLERIKKYAGLLPPVNTWEEACSQTEKVYGPWLQDLDNSMWLTLAKRAYKENEKGHPVLDMDENIGRAIKEIGEQKGDPWSLFDSLQQTNVMVLRGEISDVLSDEILKKMHKRNPEIHSVIIPKRGHVPLLDEVVSLQAIDNFLGKYC